MSQDPSLPSPPAPLDLGRLETDAKIAASKHVANLLQRPDQLEKVDQIRRRIARKKASVEAMLKTAVQSQLDGVRTGLNQLQSALQDVYEIKGSLDDIGETYKKIEPMKEKLGLLREENSNYCQLAAAVENLKHIFTVPESVRKTQEHINDGKLLQAHKHLTDLETSRDDLLFELHRQPNQSPTDKNTLKHYFEDVEKLSESLGKQLWVILQRTLQYARREPTLIVTCLRIIEREDRTDHVLLKRQVQTGFQPPGRPKRWKDRAFEVLQESISAKIEGNQFEDRSINAMWLVRHLEVTRQLMIDDFQVVKKVLPSVFPPEYNIVKRYVQMYHNGLSQHLLELVNQELEDKEIVNLLTWINCYDTPELMKHPDVMIDTKDLGPLLEPNVIDELQNTYLKNMKQNIFEWSRNTLRTDIKDWYRDEEPDTDGQGYFNTSLPVIFFDMMEQNLKVARIIKQDMVRKVLELFTEELNQFAQEYIGELQSYRDRHLQDRSQPKYFLHYMIANINNSLTFGELILERRKQHLENDFDEEQEDDTDIRKDHFQRLVDRFLQVAKYGREMLLEEVFIDLRHSNCLSELMTKQWLNSSNAVDTISATIEDYHQDFVHLKPKMFENLMLEAQKKILKAYLTALLSRKLSFKSGDADPRRKASEKIIKESLQLGQIFERLGSKPRDSMFDVLPRLAEVLKLRDTSMMSLEITGLVNKHPDIRYEQLISLLLCRGDMGRNEAKQMVLDTLGEEDQTKSRPSGIFSEINVT